MRKLRQFLKVAPVVVGLTLSYCTHNNSNISNPDKNYNRANTLSQLENSLKHKSADSIAPTLSRKMESKSDLSKPEPFDLYRNVHPVYDSKYDVFIDRKGGVDEEILNEYCKEYKNANDIEVVQLCDNCERQTLFFNPTKDSVLTDITQNNTEMINSIMIDAILCDSVYNFQTNSTVPFRRSIHKEYIPLKKLVDGMEKIYYNHDDKIMKLKESYNLISTYIQSGEITKDRSMNILYLTNNNMGDCNDLTPAYTALLRYYGFDVKMPVSFVTLDTLTALHTWLQVKIDDKVFDLDPTWHTTFMPLNPRLKQKSN